jgi:hypothetical protein
MSAILLNGRVPGLGSMGIGTTAGIVAKGFQKLEEDFLWGWQQEAFMRRKSAVGSFRKPDSLYHSC